MKKIFLFLLVGMFMISFASAVQFNNVKVYNEETKTITIKESALGSPIVNITLLMNTPGIEWVETENGLQALTGVSKDELVAELEIINIGDATYQDIFQDWKMYDNNDNLKRITKTLDLKRKVLYIDQEPVYNVSTCPENYTDFVSDCNFSIGGYTEKIKFSWERLTPADIMKGQKMTVGLFANTYEGESVEWIPTMWGVDIEEFATWNASVETGMVESISMNESGTLIDSLGNFTITTGGGLSYQETGANATTTNYSTYYLAAGYINTSVPFTTPFTATNVMFLKVNNSQSNKDLLRVRQNSGTDRGWHIDDDDTISYYRYNGASAPHVTVDLPSGTFTDGNWRMIAWVENSSGGYVWIDGAFLGSNTGEHNYTDMFDNYALIGAKSDGGTAVTTAGASAFSDENMFWNRDLSSDELDMIWNSGYFNSRFNLDSSPTLIITLDAPANTTYTTQPISVNWVNDSAYDVAYYNLNGAGNTTLTQNDTVDAVFGYNSLIIYANDSSTGDWASDTEYFNFQPTLLTQQLSPANGTNQSSTTPTLTWNVTKNGTIAITNVTLRKDNVVIYTNNSGLEGDYSYTDILSDGDWHYWNITVVGNDSNEYNSSETWQYAFWNNDTLTATLLEPANGTNQSSNTPTLIWNISYNGLGTKALANTSLVYDDSIVYSNTTGILGNYSYTPTLSDGDWHTWRVIAYDNESNLYNSSATNYIAWWNNETLITVTLNSPADSSTVAKGNNFFTTNYTMNNAFANVSFLSNISGTWARSNTTTYTYNVSIEDFSNYVNDITNYTTGIYGNTNITTVYNMTYFTSAPSNFGAAGVLNSTQGNSPPSQNATFAARAHQLNYSNITKMIAPQGMATNLTFMYALLPDSAGNDNLTLSLNFTHTNGTSLGSHLLNVLNNTNWTKKSLVLPAGTTNITFIVTNTNLGNGALFYLDYLNITSLNGHQVEYNIQEDSIWNFEFCSTDGVCNTSTSNFTVNVDKTAPTLNITTPIGLYDYGKVGNTTTLNWNISDTIGLDTCYYAYGGSNTSVTCSDNTTTFTLADTTQEISFWANDTSGNAVVDVQNWSYKVEEVARYFNTTVGQTETTSFTIDLDGNASLTNVTFYYNGTSYNAVQSGTNWTSSLTSPDSGSYDFYWNVTYGSEYIITDTSTQTVTSLSLGFCNSTLLYPFLDLRFADESNVTNNLSSSVSSGNIYFWLSDSTQNITFSFSNVTENSNYTFCASPTDDTISLIYDLTYSSSGYNQRRVRSPITLTTNTTINDTLYLLSTGDSSQKTLQVVDAVNNLITGALITVERDLSGYKLVASGLTGAAGSLAVYLDGDVEYRFNVSKSGFSSTSSIFAPSEDSYTFTLGVESISQIVDYTDGINISIRPGADTQLLNDTAYNFNLTLTADNDNLDLYGFYLLDEDGNVIDSKFSSDSSGDTINILINTGSYKEVVMKYIWSINNTNQTVYTYWNVFNTQYNSWSISNFFSDLNAYLDSGLFGIDGFGKLIIVYIIVLITLGYMTSKYGFVNEITLSIIVFAVIYFFEIAVGLLPNVLGYSGFFTTLAGVIAVALIINRGLSR